MSPEDQGEVSFSCLDGTELSFLEGKEIRWLKYTEYHKREVFLLRYFFSLFDSTDIPFPDDFQIFAGHFPLQVEKVLFPYKIEWRSHIGSPRERFLWVILGLRNFNELFVIARTELSWDLWRLPGYGALTSSNKHNIKWVNDSFHK